MIAILADDLTSALDGAAPFASRGLQAKVAFDSRKLLGLDADVVSLDLDSRLAAPDVAEERFRTAGAALAHAQLLYKTVDSTLRGNLCAEARGTMAGSGRQKALVAPAFPAAGRTTLGGRQLVHGVEVDLTEFGRDALNPVSSCLVADHFAELGAAAFSVCDAVKDGELDALVSRTGLGADLLWIGSPGLAAALARALPTNAGPRRPKPWRAVRRVLVVVGSRHRANAAQIDSLRAAGAVLVAAPAPLSSPGGLAQAICAAFEEADVVCLLAPTASVEAHDGSSERLARWLGEVVSLSAPSVEGVVVTGGDTARRVTDALHAHCLHLVGEVEAGVPLAWLDAPRGGVAFATKAGGFGDPRTLLRCVEAMRTRDERAA